MEVPEDHLRKISGTYVSGEGARIRFELEEQGLRAVLRSKGEEHRYPVCITGFDSLSIEEDGKDTNVFFLFNPKGEVWAMRRGTRLIYKVE